jgi:hypothetical protein
MSNDIQTALVNWTVTHSGHENNRSYIGLSGIGDCDRICYDRYFHGSPAHGVNGHLLCRISYELEAALIERLKASGLYTPADPISLYDGLVQGHPDGFINSFVDHDLLEIKTVAEEQHFPKNGRVGRRIYRQVQAYLHYTKRKRAQVLYLARANGALAVVTLGYNPTVAFEIVGKLEHLVQAVKNVRQPNCTCGRCA